jgi:hypothetical protein
MWKTVARRSDPGTTQQICDTRVTAILVETAVHELVEIAWANDHKLAVDTARRLAEVFQIAVDNETT